MPRSPGMNSRTSSGGISNKHAQAGCVSGREKSPAFRRALCIQDTRDTANTGLGHRVWALNSGTCKV